jgi:di/tricarboxylate transporter
MDPAVVQITSLSPHGLAVLLFAVLVFAAFLSDRIAIATISIAILVILPTGFTVFPLALANGSFDPLSLFAGFGHPALIAICALMVVGQGLVVTGALEPAARRLATWVSKQPRLALLAVLVGAAAASGLVNDTPVVVLLIPLIIAAAQRAKLSAATMLLPMNYAVLIGGMATTIGTSTNLIVMAIALSLGVGPFGLFSFYPLVAMAALPALLYLWLLVPRMLAGVKQPVEELSAELFDAELHVETGSWLDGRLLHEARAATGNRLGLVEVRRGRISVTPMPTLKLRAGDRLVVRNTPVVLKDFESTLKAKLHRVGIEDTLAGAQQSEETDKEERDEPAPATAVVAQMIVTPSSPLVGSSVRLQYITQRYEVALVGLRTSEATNGWQRENLSDRTLQAGDILLLQGEPDAFREAQHDRIGLLLDARFTLPRQDKANLALLTMAAVVILAATKTLPISLAALAGILVLVIGRCLSWEDVTQSLSVKVILLVTSSLALGDALFVSGATAWMAQQLALVAGDLSPGWVLALLMGLMGLLTNFVSNNTTGYRTGPNLGCGTRAIRPRGTVRLQPVLSDANGLSDQSAGHECRGLSFFGFREGRHPAISDHVGRLVVRLDPLIRTLGSRLRAVVQSVASQL